ncbi:hypothetical protein FS837_001169 [Tulasnella sp. UAMH 9824]|nr:hypothetical protein FS837_001169 [Tulasnella sp. UAMH 9824]
MTPADKQKELKRISNQMIEWTSLKHLNVPPYRASQRGVTPVFVSSRHRNGNISQDSKAHSDADCVKVGAPSPLFVHSESIVHDVINPTIVADGHPMLMDFGMAPDLRMVERNMTMADAGRENVGYMSPELIEEENYTVKKKISGTLDPRSAQQSTSPERVDSADDSMLQPGVQLNKLPPPLKGKLTPGDLVGWGGYSENPGLHQISSTA